MNKFELESIYDARKSFYKKAIVLEDEKFLMLRSYGVNILQYDKIKKSIEFLTANKNHFTHTTNRHINEFLQQFTSESRKTKNELLKMANIQ